jgi:DNA-binding IclR family transcriptional regulator
VVATRNWVGKRTPLHATSSGKVLLAYADAETVAEVLDGGLERYTEHTVTDPRALREELTGVRGRDWACCREELEVGLNSVAAPIFAGDGEMVGAVSVSGPSYRLTTDDFPSIAERLLAGADAISVRLGYFPHR